MLKCARIHTHAHTCHHSGYSDLSLWALSPFTALATLVTPDRSRHLRDWLGLKAVLELTTWLLATGHMDLLTGLLVTWQPTSRRARYVTERPAKVHAAESSLISSTSSPVPDPISSTHQACYRAGGDHTEVQRWEGRRPLGAILETGFHRLVVPLLTTSPEYRALESSSL